MVNIISFHLTVKTYGTYMDHVYISSHAQKCICKHICKQTFDSYVGVIPMGFGCAPPPLPLEACWPLRHSSSVNCEASTTQGTNHLCMKTVIVCTQILIPCRGPQRRKNFEFEYFDYDSSRNHIPRRPTKNLYLSP